MFFDIGSLEFIVLVVLAVMVFGPEKLPKMIQDAVGFLRKVREFSDSAKQDIRNELGPEFKDFEFEDLNPRTFARKHLLDNDDLGLKELTSSLDSLDMRKELSEVTDAVNGRPASVSLDKRTDPGRKADLDKDGGSGRRTSLDKPAGGSGSANGGGSANGTGGARPAEEPPPFDADAT